MSYSSSFSSSFSSRPLPTIHDAARSIQLLGHENTIVVQGTPGVGKTGILSLIAEMNGDVWRRVGDETRLDCGGDKFDYVYIDCSNLQYGDLLAMVPDRETRQIEEYVGGLFHLNDARPKVIMFDEVLKLPKSMKPIVTRIMRERTVGARPFPRGTVVFGTSNNAADGIGDTTQAHEGNRITFLPMHMPRDTWMPWAVANNVNPTLLAWVQATPELFESYMTVPADKLAQNPYVWNPKKPTHSFVSPRSLVTAANYMDQRHVLGLDLTITLIAGCMGEAAAEGLRQFALMENDMVDPAVIKSNPMGAPVPGSRITQLITLFRSVHEIATQEDLSAYVTYVGRLNSKELETAWAVSVMSAPQTAGFCRRNMFFKQWRLENGVYLRAS